MSEMIVKLNADRVKLNGCEYVQDLVRCKECKYRNGNYVDMTPPYTHEYCRRWTRYVVAEDFCSCAERKE